MDKNYRYEIDENNAISIYDVDNVGKPPFMFQPDYPNFDPFKDKADAIKWAEAKMAELLDPNAPLAPFGYGYLSMPKTNVPIINSQYLTGE